MTISTTDYCSRWVKNRKRSRGYWWGCFFRVLVLHRPIFHLYEQRNTFWNNYMNEHEYEHDWVWPQIDKFRACIFDLESVISLDLSSIFHGRETRVIGGIECVRVAVFRSGPLGKNLTCILISGAIHSNTILTSPNYQVHTRRHKTKQSWKEKQRMSRRICEGVSCFHVIINWRVLEEAHYATWQFWSVNFHLRPMLPRRLLSLDLTRYCPVVQPYKCLWGIPVGCIEQA